MKKIDWFNKYTDLGLKTIPLYPKTKVPISSNWYNSWHIDKYRNIFKLNPSLNIGIILGDIIDVEGDTSEAEDLIIKMIKDYPHPMYKSSRSIHHIFINPKPDLTLKKIKGIEFRANKHQSVVPPSLHENGVKYHWIKGTKFPIPIMPDELIRLLESTEEYLKIKPSHMRVCCSVCKNMKFIHEKRYRLEVKIFKNFNSNWKCHKCRRIDIRPVCKKLKRRL